jgi:hypothetical protein
MSRLQTLFIVFFSIMSATRASANECWSWGSSCKNIQATREANFADPPSTCATCVDRTDPFPEVIRDRAQSNDIVQKLQKASTQVFMNCMKQEVQKIEEMQKNDIHVILAELEKRKINAVSRDFLKDIVANRNSVFQKAKAKMIKMAGIPFDQYRKFTLDGPIRQMEESIVGTVNPWVNRYQISILAQFKKSKPDEIFNALKDVASTSDADLREEYSISNSRDRPALTPLVAKMILFEALKDKLKDNPKDLKAVLKKIKLKFDFLDPYNQDIDDPDTITLHNGYFMGATPANFPNQSKPFQSTGYDCTSLIQKCYSDAGMKFSSSFKLLSDRLTALGSREEVFYGPEMREYRKNFETIPFQCEAQLKVGDIVTFDGHSFVFAGYERDRTGKIQMVTYEGIGNEYRGVGKFYRQLYDGEGACGGNKLTPYTNQPNRVSIVRVKQ